MGRSSSSMIKDNDEKFLKRITCKHCHGTGRVKNGKLCVRCRSQGYWLKSLNEDVYKICELCHGTGMEHYPLRCKHCGGWGYYSWLDDIFPRPYKSDISGNDKYKSWVFTYDIKSSIEPIDKKIIDEMVKSLQVQIDEEITKSITEVSSKFSSTVSYLTNIQSIFKTPSILGFLNGRDIS